MPIDIVVAPVVQDGAIDHVPARTGDNTVLERDPLALGLLDHPHQVRGQKGGLC